MTRRRRIFPLKLDGISGWLTLDLLGSKQPSVSRHDRLGSRGSRIVQELVEPLRISLPLTRIGQVCAEPGCPEKNCPIKHVVPRHGAPFTPFAINVAPLVFVAHILAMTIETTVRCIHAGPLVGCTRIAGRSQGAGRLVLVLLQASKRNVWISCQCEPG